MPKGVAKGKDGRKNSPKNHKKLTDEQFLSILRENAGLYSQTAKAIERQFKIKYSRQAARERAEKFPKEVAEIEEHNLDCAEHGLHTLIKTSTGTVKLKALELLLKTKGKKRGYVERREIEMGNMEGQEFRIGGQVIKF